MVEKDKSQKVYFSSVGNPDSFTIDMNESEYLDMFIHWDLWHLMNVENKWLRKKRK